MNQVMRWWNKLNAKGEFNPRFAQVKLVFCVCAMAVYVTFSHMLHTSDDIAVIGILAGITVALIFAAFIMPMYDAPKIVIVPKPPAMLKYMDMGKLLIMPSGNYVYILHDRTVTGFFKIGKATHPYKRLADFGVKLPFEVGLVAVIACKDMNALESNLHIHFKDKRVRGEWFALTLQDIEYIKGLS